MRLFVFPLDKTQKVAETGDIEEDLSKFRELQRIVGSYLEGNTTSQARLW